MLKVAVIGAGPAGLAAAHAAVGREADVTVFAPRQMSPQRGPLLMQHPIPGVNNDHPDGYIKQMVVGGNILDYRYKLYGDVNIGINGDILADGYHAWKHRETYRELWDRYYNLVNNILVSPLDLSQMHEAFDLVVSTAPLPKLCMKPGNHEFRYATVYTMATTSYPDQPDNTIIFNARTFETWVRSSRVFGVPVTEWPVGAAPANATEIHKPISTTCNCFPHVLRTGRFGKFRNETWIPDAYYDTLSAIESIHRAHEWAPIENTGR